MVKFVFNTFPINLVVVILEVEWSGHEDSSDRPVNDYSYSDGGNISEVWSVSQWTLKL